MAVDPKFCPSQMILQHHRGGFSIQGRPVLERVQAFIRQMTTILGACCVCSRDEVKTVRGSRGEIDRETTVLGLEETDVGREAESSGVYFVRVWEKWEPGQA